MNWTVSPTAAVTVLGLKVRPPFGPTITCWVAARTDADCIKAKVVDLVKCILMLGICQKTEKLVIDRTDYFRSKECNGSNKE